MSPQQGQEHSNNTYWKCDVTQQWKNEKSHSHDKPMKC